MQGARHRDGDEGPEVWLGRRAKASGSSPLKLGGHISHQAPGAAAGGFLLDQAPSLPVEGSLVRATALGHPGTAARDDGFELVAHDVPEAVVDGAQEAE